MDIMDGMDIEIHRGDSWQMGTVASIDGDTVRVAVDGADHIPTRVRTTVYRTTVGADDIRPYCVDTHSPRDLGPIDPTTDDGVQGDTTDDGAGWTTTVLDDGSRIVTNPFGRSLFVNAPDTIAPNGIPTVQSFRTNGVQGARTIARTDIDGNPWALGCTEDTTGVATCTVCGETTSVRKFPTDGDVRIAVHRGCNSARLAGAQGVTRQRQNMAN